MKIGVRAHDIGKLAVTDLADAVKAFGFDGVQLVFQKALGKQIDDVDLKEVKDIFGDSIMMLGAYFNMTHPDKGVIEAGVINFKKHLEISRSLDVKYVGTETGSLMGSPWGYVPENHSEESFIKVVKVVSELVNYAKDHLAYVAIEGAYAHTIYSPGRLRQLLDVIGSDRLKVTIDLYNFLNIDNHVHHMDIFKQALELLKDDIVIFHLKDYIVKDETLVQVGLGKGLMKYDEIIPLMISSNPNAYLIFEGVKHEDMKDSLLFIKKLLKRNEGEV